MLVISAQEGVKPQTVEHLAICGLLGVRAGLTVITKIDTVSPSRARTSGAGGEGISSWNFSRR